MLTGSQGILFLTTNRVGQFDDAFKSRIHISLFYPNLELKATLEIWGKHLKRIQKAKPTYKIQEAEILKYAEDHFKELREAKLESWNGRYT
jgi:hypothetical protein